jgi:hypothetical protein
MAGVPGGAGGLGSGLRAGSALNLLEGGKAVPESLMQYVVANPKEYPLLMRKIAAHAQIGDVPDVLGAGVLHEPSYYTHEASTADTTIPFWWKEQGPKGSTSPAAEAAVSPAELKQVYENSWKKGNTPFSDLSNYVKKQTDGEKGVYNIISPDDKTAWDKELTTKYGDWLDRGEGDEEAVTAHSASPRDYAAHFEPLDWSSHQTDPHAFADVPDWLRKHGEQLGFNFDVPLWKGGHPEYPSKIADPAMEKRLERGLFTTPQKHVAEVYGTPLPYVARSQNALSVDWKKATGSHYYDEAHMTPLIEQARDQKADLLAIHNVMDIGGKGKPQSQYVVLDPSILRAPSAKFNVDDLHKAAPLAGIATIAGYPVFRDSASSEEKE